MKKQSDGYGGTFLDIFHDDMPTASIRGGKDGGFVTVFNDEGHRTVSMQNNPGPKPCSPTQGGIAVFDGSLDDTVLLTWQIKVVDVLKHIILKVFLRL